MSTGCNRRGPQISGTPPTIECESINYNTVAYEIANATYAYWTQSSLPSVRNRIDLISGAATDTLEVDSTDTYKICAEACGGCGRVCCEFDCDVDLNTTLACTCVDSVTLSKQSIAYFEVEVDTASPESFSPGSPFTSCSAVDCANVDGTHIIPCSGPYYLINHVFICTAPIGGVDYDIYVYMHILLLGVAGDLVISIEHGMVAYTVGSTPPTDVLPETVSHFAAIYRYWRWRYRFDAPTTTITNECSGDSATLRLCSIGTGVANVNATETFRSGGCPKPTVTVVSLGLV
jgi:hypothetical protein